MKIFDMILNGDDAKFFCSQSVEYKIDWIQTHTSVKDIDVIMDWINHPPKNINGGCGCGCGESKAKPEVKKAEPEIRLEAPIEDEIETEIDELKAEITEESNKQRRGKFRRK